MRELSCVEDIASRGQTEKVRMYVWNSRNVI